MTPGVPGQRKLNSRSGLKTVPQFFDNVVDLSVHGNDSESRIEEQVGTRVTDDRVAIAERIEHEYVLEAIFVFFLAHTQRTTIGHQAVGFVMNGLAFAVTQPRGAKNVL
jgi:hypothetical protein